jgi:hypothetical protein
MNFKSIIALLSIFIIQFLASCGWCDCNPQSYEVEYDGITIIPWNTAGFNATEVTDTVYRNAFGLTVSVNFEPKKVSQIMSNFGFSGAYACDCDGDEYNFVDPIDHAEIFMTDVTNDEKINVTEFFGAHGYSAELISLAELFSIRQEWHNGFQFELIEFDSIPASVVFSVNVYLASGIMFSEQTQRINFHD